VTPQFDTKFNAAKGFTIVAAFFGMLSFLTLAVSSCCPLDGGRMKCLSIYFFLATLFQGLVFIIYRSNACAEGFFDVYFEGDTGTGNPFNTDVVESLSCGLAKGSKMAVSATVLYFVCMLLAPAAIPPTPVPMPMIGED